MTGRTLVARSLHYYWRSHLGVLFGAILGAAILVGALAVGDSVRFSLRELALARIRGVHLALHSQDRFFREQLGPALEAELAAPVAPVLMLRGTASGGETRVGRVQVIGADTRFWKLGGAAIQDGAEPEVILNERLARKLGSKVGDEVLIRLENPSVLSRDAPLAKTDDSTIAVRLQVGRIVGDGEFGRFSLEASQIPPYNAYLPLSYLQSQLDRPGKVNALLVGAGTRGGLETAAAGEAFRRQWKLVDAGLQVRSLKASAVTELRTDRVFLDPPSARAALAAAPGSFGILSYFVNELRVGNRATPYSIVSAMDGRVTPPRMADDEVVINEWLAEDLKAKPGDRLDLKYFVSGPQRRLIEKNGSFRIRSVIPISGAAADRNLMPDFPGVSDSENCRDWKPGIPVDLEKIRKQDEAYWDAHRGTPKAFITLAAGQKLWGNRWGDLTAVRYPASVTEATLAAGIQTELAPEALGLFFQPIRDQALAASSQAMDFGGLFIGFSFFLIVAALLLMALLFAFGVEQRASEIGLLLALGYEPKMVRRLLLVEGGAIALIASVAGGVIGVWYTQAVVAGLSTIWKDAVADSLLRYHAEPATLAAGAVGAFFVALFTIWLVARKQAHAPARELLASGNATESGPMKPSARKQLPGVATAVVCAVGALVLSGLAFTGSHAAAAGYFFGGGALLLIAGIAACRAYFARLAGAVVARALTIGSLGARNTVRRAGRSVAVVALLACGSFLVVSIGASRHDPHEGAYERDSGTGGFALYGESSVPIFHDLNSEAGRDEWGLGPEELEGVRILPLRLRSGDEASCLNLNRAQTPRLLGVDTAELRSLKPFAFSSTIKGTDAKDPWSVLDRPDPDGAIPAVGDMNTVMWSLEKGVGATIDYRDDRGQPFKVRIVGIIGNSVLQGSLLISEQQFEARFPAESGYQVFLVDAKPDRAAAVAPVLERALEDAGLELTSTAVRLGEFNSVENTYLSIFAVLGGLGLLLGSLGLGVVVLRNVLERRGELALLRAVGFGRPALQWMVFSEHALLLGLGLVVGVVSAVLAVLPALGSPGAEVPYGTLVVTLLAVLVSGVVWTWGATVLALRGPLMSGLRSE